MKDSAESSNLDFLRATAVLLVAFSHLGHTFHRATPFVGALGQWGVLIFFVHTSTVLMMSLHRLNLTGWKLFASFYLRRAFRIYPLSILCVTAILVLRIPISAWELPFHPFSARDILGNLGLVMNLTGSPVVTGPLWSLPYEIQMYLVLPLLFLFLKTFNSVKAALFVWLVGTALSHLVLRSNWHMAFFIPGVPCFLAGVVAYQMRKRIHLPRLSFWVWTAAIFVITFVVADPHRPFHFVIGWDKTHEVWPLCLLLAVLFPFCKETGLGWLRIASKAIAKYSYGIYLTHVPVMYVAFVWLGWLPLAVRWLAFAVLMMTLPVLAYCLLEKPMIGVGSRLAQRWKQPENSPHPQMSPQRLAAAVSNAAVSHRDIA